MQKASVASAFHTYNQLLVALKQCFCTAFRQVSRLEDHCIRHLPGLPVIYRLQLPNYGDEFVQDLHLLPFSPEPATYVAAPAPEYSIFNCGYYITDFLKLQCQSEIGAILGIAQDHFL